MLCYGQCQPKHARLINRCYPVKAAEPKPNSSELSYLCTYASTRPSKLPKVGKYLEAKTSRCIRKKRNGDVIVTMQIVTGLINRCKADLNLLSKSVLHILKAVFASKDRILIENTVPMFVTFCANHDGALLPADSSYERLYLSTLQNYVGLACRDVAEEDKHLRCSGSEAISAAMSSAALKIVPHGLTQISIVMPGLVHNLKTAEQVRHAMSLIDLGEQLSKETTRERHSQDTYALSHRASIIAPTLDEEDIVVNVLRSLHTLFELDMATHLVRGLETLISDSGWSLDYEPKEWISQLVINCTKWTKVHLRYTLLVRLCQLLNENSSRLVIARLIGDLLLSEVNFIGLSIVDTLNALVDSVIACMVGNRPEYAEEYLFLLQRAIGGLGRHIYYNDQIFDVCFELLGWVRPWSRSADEASEEGVQQTDEGRIYALESMTLVMKNARNTDSVSESNVSFILWAGTYETLLSVNPATQAAYVRALQEHLNLYSLSSTQQNQNEVIPDERVVHFLSTMHLTIFEVLRAKNSTPTGFIMIGNLLLSFVRHFGIVEVTKGIPMLFKALEMTSEDSVRQLAVSNLLAIYLQYAANHLHWPKVKADMDLYFNERRASDQLIGFEDSVPGNLDSHELLWPSATTSVPQWQRSAVIADLAFEESTIPDIREQLLLDWTPESSFQMDRLVGSSFPPSSLYRQASRHSTNSSPAATTKENGKTSVLLGPATIRIDDLRRVLAKGKIEGISPPAHLPSIAVNDKTAGSSDPVKSIELRTMTPPQKSETILNVLDGIRS